MKVSKLFLLLLISLLSFSELEKAFSCGEFSEVLIELSSTTEDLSETDEEEDSEYLAECLKPPILTASSLGFITPLPEQYSSPQKSLLYPPEGQI